MKNHVFFLPYGVAHDMLSICICKRLVSAIVSAVSNALKLKQKFSITKFFCLASTYMVNPFTATTVI